MFSSPEVAQYINENFEPAWEMVRPVPTITIDFGNGKKMTRTVNGNIATYVCTRDGYIVDVLPGIFDSATYLDRLSAIKRQFETLPSDQPGLVRELANYHLNAETRKAVIGSAGAERRTIASPLIVGAFKPQPERRSISKSTLIADTEINENERRPIIHSVLKYSGLVKPDDLKKWLYREVLHADLDDPYLGFDKILTQSYPFDDGGS